MKKIPKKIGAVAIKKGFITKAQFKEAMGKQIEMELEGEKPTLLGEILLEMEYLNKEQLFEVLSTMDKNRTKVATFANFKEGEKYFQW